MVVYVSVVLDKPSKYHPMLLTDTYTPMFFIFLCKNSISSYEEIGNREQIL